MSKKETRNKVNIAIGVPMERTLHQLAFHPFLRIAAQGYPFIPMPYTRNDIARNRFAEALLASEHTHLLMLDSDHVHPEHVVFSLGRWVEAKTSPEIRVIGGLNFRRGKPFDPCAYMIAEDGTVSTMFDWHPGLVEVDAIGAGSLLVHRSVFEELPQPWFWYEYRDHESSVQYPGTDMGFSKRCREAGIKIWVDTTCTSPHIDDYLVGESAYRAYMNEHPELIESMGSREPGWQASWMLGERAMSMVASLLSEGSTILEFGSGDGSGILAEVYEVYSVEHDEDWLGRSENVHYIHAPLKTFGAGREWYDVSAIQAGRPAGVDLVIVDGPPADVGRQGFLEALGAIDDSLFAGVPILIDDVHRPNDRMLIDQVARITGRDYSLYIESDNRRMFGLIL